MADHATQSSGQQDLASTNIDKRGRTAKEKKGKGKGIEKEREKVRNRKNYSKYTCRNVQVSRLVEE